MLCGSSACVWQQSWGLDSTSLFLLNWIGVWANIQCIIPHVQEVIFELRKDSFWNELYMFFSSTYTWERHGRKGILSREERYAQGKWNVLYISSRLAMQKLFFQKRVLLLCKYMYRADWLQGKLFSPYLQKNKYLERHKLNCFMPSVMQKDKAK